MTIELLEQQASLYEPYDPERAKLYRDQIPYHKRLKENQTEYERKLLLIRAGLPPE